MRAIIQRVKKSSVFINETLHNSINNGLLILIGIKSDDLESDALYLAEKCANLRIFADEHNKMNLSVKDINGEALVISQFTLYAETQKGNRPSYINAATPNIANPLYLKFIHQLSELLGTDKVKSGVFGADMQVELINDGPVTIILESKIK